MVIDGKKIASIIYDDLKKRALLLKQQGVTPHLIVILIGNDPASVAYVNQKKKWSEEIGILFSLVHYNQSIAKEELLQAIHHVNQDSSVHGIIIQRPIPQQIDQDQLLQIIDPQKDVDGFHPTSPFEVPVAQAVWKILEEIYKETKGPQGTKDPNEEISPGTFGPFISSGPFLEWLHSKNIVVVGKGETAGKPVIDFLKKQNLSTRIIDSKTENPELIMQSADILISAVGKPGIISANNLKQGAILIGVGITKDGEESLQGDYNEEEIKNIVSFYTPTPGGVGPVNVAYLLTNLIKAAENLPNA